MDNTFYAYSMFEGVVSLDYQTTDSEFIGSEYKLSADGNRLAISNPDINDGRGVVTIYQKTDTGYNVVTQIQNTNGQPQDKFGSSIDFSSNGELLFSASPYADTNNRTDSGRFSVFRIEYPEPPTPTPAAIGISTSSLCIRNSSVSVLNGTYEPEGIFNGRTKWSDASHNNNGYFVYWPINEFGFWGIALSPSDNPMHYAQSGTFPWDGGGEIGASQMNGIIEEGPCPTPTPTPVPSTPTSLPSASTNFQLTDTYILKITAPADWFGAVMVNTPMSNVATGTMTGTWTPNAYPSVVKLITKDENLNEYIWAETPGTLKDQTVTSWRDDRIVRITRSSPGLFSGETSSVDFTNHTLKDIHIRGKHYPYGNNWDNSTLRVELWESNTSNELVKYLEVMEFGNGQNTPTSEEVDGRWIAPFYTSWNRD
jgi:hypothetical protein